MVGLSVTQREGVGGGARRVRPPQHGATRYAHIYPPPSVRLSPACAIVSREGAPTWVGCVGGVLKIVGWVNNLTHLHAPQSASTQATRAWNTVVHFAEHCPLLRAGGRAGGRAALGGVAGEVHPTRYGDFIFCRFGSRSGRACWCSRQGAPLSRTRAREHDSGRGSVSAIHISPAPLPPHRGLVTKRIAVTVFVCFADATRVKAFSCRRP